MNPYILISSKLDSNEAHSLSARLSAWHDAMVAHERRLRAGSTGDTCDDECPHAEAGPLWLEAVSTFGDRAEELTFLRSRAEARKSRGTSDGRGLPETVHPASTQVPAGQANDRRASAARTASAEL